MRCGGTILITGKVRRYHSVLGISSHNSTLKAVRPSNHGKQQQHLGLELFLIFGPLVVTPLRLPPSVSKRMKLPGPGD